MFHSRCIATRSTALRLRPACEYGRVLSHKAAKDKGKHTMLCYTHHGSRLSAFLAVWTAFFVVNGRQIQTCYCL